MKFTTLLLVAVGLLSWPALAGAQTPQASHPTSQPAGQRAVVGENAAQQNFQQAIENAQRMLAAQNYEQAVKYFLDAIRLNPMNAQTLVRLGDAYRQWSLTNDAVAGKDAVCYLNALAVDPDNLDALSRVMAIYVDQVEFRHTAEDFDGLKNTAQKIVHLHPQDADLYRRAQAYAAIAPLAGWLYGIATSPADVDQDMKTLAALMTGNDFNSDIPYYLAQCYLNQALEERRQENIEDAQKKFHEAKAVFEEAIKAQPHSPRLLMRYYLLLNQADQKFRSDEQIPEFDQSVPRMQELLKQARMLVDDAMYKSKEEGEKPGENEALASYTDVYYHSVEFASRHPERDLDFDEAMKLAQHWLEFCPADQSARLMMAELLGSPNDPAQRARAIALMEKPITDPGGVGIGTVRSHRSLQQATDLRLINLLIEQWTATADASTQAAIRRKIDVTFADFTRIMPGGSLSYDAKKLEGRIQLQTGGADGAIAAVAALTQAETLLQRSAVQDLDLDWLLAQAYAKTQQNGKAEQRLVKICKLLPNVFASRILYAQLLLKDGNLAEAAKQIAQIVKQWPDDPTVKDLEIQLLLRAPGDPNAAKLLPDLIAPFEKTANTKAQILAIADALWTIGQTDRALAILEQARAKTPGDYDFVQRLALMYQSRNQNDLAHKVLDEALAAAPSNAQFKVLKLSLDGAAPELIRAAQREVLNQIADPLTRELRFYDFEASLSYTDAALKHLDNAEKISPDDKFVLDSRFCVSIKLQQWERAQAVINKLAALNADQAGGQIYQFRLEMARGDYPKAQAAAQKLANQMPNFARPHLCLGQVLQARRQYEAAIKEFQNALEAQNSTEALDGMMSCYYTLSKPAEALMCIRRGLQWSPHDAAFAQESLRNYLNYDPNLDPDVIAALLRAGANLNARDADGATPLMGAAQHNSNSDVVVLLLKAGADLSARDNLGRTSLMHAAGNSNPGVVGELLKAGADVNAQDNSGKTALDDARANNNPEAAAELIQAGAKEK